jgi:stress-induced morphogen
MTQTAAPAWHARRTEETNQVEKALQQEGFEQAGAYRYNSASIRVRVIDSKFEGKPRDQRDAMVEAVLDKLPEEIQRDIVTVFTFAPSELRQTSKTFREVMLNAEFEDPSPSDL